MAAGLRVQILFWSFHGRAKMRGGMPRRPARIVEYGARENDKIGIASSNDRLSLIIEGRSRARYRRTTLRTNGLAFH